MNLCKVNSLIAAVSRLQLSLPSITSTLVRHTSSESNEVTKKTYNSEGIPPIPNYKGWQGDDNHVARQVIQEIRKRFKHGFVNEQNYFQF